MIVLIDNTEDAIAFLNSNGYSQQFVYDIFNAKYLRVSTASRLYNCIPNAKLDSVDTSYTLVHLDILKAIALIPVDIQTMFVASLLNSCSPLVSFIGGVGGYE